MAANVKNAERILILTPTGRDASLAASALGSSGFACKACANIDELCDSIEEAAGAVIVTEEALSSHAMDCLREVLGRQPKWSDLPILVFTSQPAVELGPRSFDRLGDRANITLVERPIRVKTMTSAVETALRARRRQYEVRDLLSELERRIEERDNFLAMLSHELRNPLAAITLAVDELERSQSSELRNERSIVVRQTRHLTKLVDDLLDIARVTSGKIVLHRAEVDLADVVEHCAEAMIPRARGRGLTLTFHPPQTHAFVNGDAVLRVRDTGKGIAPEMLTRIFDIFTQGDVTIDRSDGGMGIGLTLVQKLTELHGGSVRAYSRGKGSGSEFVVRLPLVREARVTAAKPQPRAVVAPASRHIVIVEDNPDIRELLRIKLRNLGHRVEAASDGVKGLEKILEARPDLALVDIGLPGLDGYAIAQQVRERVGDDIYLVALTGYGQAEDRRKALDAGFNVHLTKPADIVDVQNVIGNLPPRKAATPEAAAS